MCKSYYARATCDMIQNGENGRLTSKELWYSIFYLFWRNFNFAVLLIILILIHIIIIKKLISINVQTTYLRREHVQIFCE